MSGPCTDCGGPDYQTLVARIAELEAQLNVSICIFCQTKVEKNLDAMLDHAKGCEERPENRLMGRIAELEAALAEARTETSGAIDQLADAYGDKLDAEAALAERTRERDEANTGTINQRRQFEKALAERDRMLRLAILDGDHPAGMDADYLADLRSRAEEGSENE